MIMQIYNTLTRKKEVFKPLHEGKVTIYACGPTVYDYFHIGNARPFITFDVLRRQLEREGYEVTFVQNFTDIDDKMIRRANQEGITVRELGERFIREYFVDAAALNVRRASVHPKATDHIQEIIDLISRLIANGHAYATPGGDVYYRVSAFPGYGKLSGQSLEEREAGASERLNVETDKESPEDFTLWKAQKPGEPAWESPWGNGRPGWHIECSAMSMKYLGETIDIHCGGKDLVFPHHENEIAQSECCNGKIFAKYWMHNAFLNIDNKKMSKSLGNFRTVRQISEQYDLQVLRFFMLSAHYRSPLNFSADLMEASKNGLSRIVNAADNLKHLLKNTSVEAMTEAEKELFAGTESFVKAYEEAMEDDFNTADAVSAVFDLVKYINSNVSAENSKELLQAMFDLLVKLTDVLGLIVDKEEEILAEDIEKLIAERQAARKAKDFARADAIRDELLAMGIILKDTREGVKWTKA